MEFETKRLLLRPWQEEDAPQLYQLAKDPSIGPIAGWTPHENEKESLKIIREVLQKELTFALVEKKTNLLLGAVGLDQESELVEDPRKEAELGYWIGVDYWGQGFAPEAAKKLLDYAFREGGFQRIWCACDARNANSMRVQEKLGFLYHHRLEKHKRSLTGEIIEKRISILTQGMWKSKGA